MPADEGNPKPLAERIVKEAITVGLETPMREPILEAIDEAGEGKKDPSRTIPMAGTLLSLGAAAGYLLGSRGGDFDVEDVPIDDLEEPDVIEDVVGEDAEDDVDEDSDAELEEESSGSLLRPLLLGVGIVAAVVFARRKLGSGDDEWEPIEEFETADDDEFGGDFGSDDDDDDEEFGGDDFGSDDFGADDDEDDEEEDDEVEVEEEAE